jgi:hypothetical protein
MNAIATGANVRLIGLLNNTSYNSQEGICYGINENGWYVIQLKSEERILVKRENIQVIPRSKKTANESIGRKTSKMCHLKIKCKYQLKIID